MSKTEKERPLILVTNDDGIKAKGLESLVKMLKLFTDVVIVAPNESYSGMSHAITVKTPLYAKLVKEKEGLQLYKVNGTPVDCVKLAINVLLPRKPDLLVSGINHGTNSSISLHYSGTVGAAREGALNKIPAVGFSLLNYRHEADFTEAVKVAEHVVKSILGDKLPSGTFLNVNIPDVSPVKGAKVARQSKGRWVEEFVERQDPRGRNYYWLTGHFENLEPEAKDTDEYLLAKGYASIVPCHLDATNFNLLSYLKEQNYEL
ncbi:5'/3'-nucleotidase SurE [Carboxylicivirga mesophila]|uniref:5'-nucleotidase SurE n=1 Tax=Carboxylicivirga mesophila TaxID=1166478 RepID=A0ABS5K8F5_9BACT|nr:5'/3'-nucleotidase SurE [Carboxylicivirga mesophila]MBS2210818.1 5'/3'-nucleotidase SurE [Carboxylicivirga mesophila]